MGKGIVQIYYGEGQGKSTAALGNAIRLASEGKSVVVIQFLKGRMETVLEYLKRLEPEIKFFRFSKQDIAFEKLSETERQEESVNLKNGFNYGKKVVSTGACDMLILDEILGLVDQKLITADAIRELVEAVPDEMKVVFTGRVLTDEIRELADEIYHISKEKGA